MYGRAYEEAARYIKRALSLIDIGNPYFAEDMYEAVEFDPKYFNPIPRKYSKKRRFVFVDGGNMEIIGAPNFSIHLVRLAYISFKGGKRCGLPIPNRIDSLVVVTRCHEGNGGKFAIKYIPLTPHANGLLCGDSVIESSAIEGFDDDLMLRPITVAGGIARKFAEWTYAERIIECCLTEGDVILRDGVLQTGIVGEREYASRAYKTAEEKGVIFCSLAKSSSLVTTTGMPLLVAVQYLAERNGIEGEWYYHPVAINKHPEYLGEIYITKLYASGPYAFRFEVHNSTPKDDIEDIFAFLMNHSRNAIFPGYPYAMVMVDKIARVERGEKEPVAMRMLGHIGKNPLVRKCLAALDAHKYISEY